MRRSSFVLSLISILWLVGCQEKLPVELTTDQSPTALAVKVLPAIDSTLIIDASVDTSGVLQSEEQMYPATFLVNGVKTDYGTSRNTFSYSRILLNDKKKPITSTLTNEVIGSLSLDVGKASVNTVELPKSFRPVRSLSSYAPNFLAGPVYTLVDQDNQPAQNFTYTPGQTYRFAANGKGAVSPFQVAIQSPDEITVLEPKAGSVVFRNEDLRITWEGQRGDSLRVLISAFDASSNVPVKPLIQAKVEPGGNSIVISSKILQGLKPHGDGRYLFSVISSNSYQTNIPGYDYSVLVQASSIHNVVLWLK